eukprot:m.10990 g.10990  ORF g.10990 m.10990 type:complete len:216 (+) comp9734_c0_seq1:60-707(+)
MATQDALKRELNNQILVLQDAIHRLDECYLPGAPKYQKYMPQARRQELRTVLDNTRKLIELDLECKECEESTTVQPGLLQVQGQPRRSRLSPNHLLTTASGTTTPTADPRTARRLEEIAFSNMAVKQSLEAEHGAVELRKAKAALNIAVLVLVVALLIATTAFAVGFYIAIEEKDASLAAVVIGFGSGLGALTGVATTYLYKTAPEEEGPVASPA